MQVLTQCPAAHATLTRSLTLYLWLLLLCIAAKRPQFQQSCAFHAVGRVLPLGPGQYGSGAVFLDSKQGVGGLDIFDSSDEQRGNSSERARWGPVHVARGGRSTNYGGLPATEGGSSR